jgi:hypothetical protein
MKKLLLASVLAIASVPGYTHAQTSVCHDSDDVNLCQACEKRVGPDADVATLEQCQRQADAKALLCHAPEDGCDREGNPPARVIVRPYQGPPIGWVYAPYTVCGELGCQVNVQADGLNVRTVPNGYPVMSLVNGTPLVPLQKQGDWLLVAPACDLTPTWAWSWNAGVPLNRCWVYF